MEAGRARARLVVQDAADRSPWQVHVGYRVAVSELHSKPHRPERAGHGRGRAWLSKMLPDARARPDSSAASSAASCARSAPTRAASAPRSASSSGRSWRATTLSSCSSRPCAPGRQSLWLVRRISKAGETHSEGTHAVR